MNVCKLSIEDVIKLKNSLNTSQVLKIEWQWPVITEKVVADHIHKIGNSNLNYYAFPWATLLNLYKIYTKGISFHEFFSIISRKYYYKNSITVCQSIHFRELLSTAYELGINKLFATHASKDDVDDIFQKWGIKILPYLHYPVNFSNDHNSERSIIASFAGAGITSPDRLILKELNINSGFSVDLYSDWFFQSDVFGNQFEIDKYKIKSANQEYQLSIKKQQYIELLRKSKYTLCPEGTGPNTVRLWEALASGSVPILISDSLILPKIANWERLVLRISPSQISSIPTLISQITDTEWRERQKACIKLSKKLIKTNYLLPIINEINLPSKIFKKKYINNISNKEKINLMSCYFHTSDQNRREEFDLCLSKNIINPYIHKIYLFVEICNIKDVFQFFRSKLYFEKKVKCIFMFRQNKRQISYFDFIKYANKYLKGSLVIISNSDIYFDDSLSLVSNIEFENTVLALTRWNIDKYKNRKGIIWERKDWSQDSWIFLSPLREGRWDINLGWIACDNRFAAELSSAGYQVLNPSKSIKTWHYNRIVDNSIKGKYSYERQKPACYVPIISIDSIQQYLSSISILKEEKLKAIYDPDLWLTARNKITRYIVVTEGRTGSNYLKTMLNSHPSVHDNGEILNINKDLIQASNSIFSEGIINYIYKNFRPPQSLQHKMCSAISSVGFKVKYEQARYSVGNIDYTILWKILSDDTDIRVIHLKRRNLFDLLVSRRLAELTGQWSSLDKSSIKINDLKFPVDGIDCKLQFERIKKRENEVDKLFKKHKMITIYYEDIVQDELKQFEIIQEFIGVDILQLKSNLEKQNTRKNSDIIINYADISQIFKNTIWSRYFNC